MPRASALRNPSGTKTPSATPRCAPRSLRVHADIAQWYHTLLMKHQGAEAARAYLKSRGINSAVAANWQMGYAPPHGDPLREWALEKKYSEKILIAAGILAQGGEDSPRAGETYPRFRHRLMFPIRNDYGEVIAFSGRLLDPEAKAAKYLNSPETPIFSKSKVFFGLDKSKRAISKANRAIVCEGQLDLITAFEHGFENVVAPLGTAFTEFHARMLKRHAEEVVLCFDSDAAGFKAAERAFAILAPTGLVVKIAPLPQGEDPDSLIRGKGADAFKSQIDAARDFFDHLLDFASATRDLNETREKTRFAADTAALIRAARQSHRARFGDSEGRAAARAFRRRTIAARSRAWQDRRPGEPTAGKLPRRRNPCPRRTRRPSSWSGSRWRTRRSCTGCAAPGARKSCGDLGGTELLARIWKAPSDFPDAASLSAFISTLPGEEEHALNQILSQPMPAGNLAGGAGRACDA